ncbi:MAG: ABC transporter ATP-binding protein [Thermoproteota archaeon]|nr:MAG: ABC transporter ATP-binding protein [Candidatus Korarchaeota archaeon]
MKETGPLNAILEIKGLKAYYETIKGYVKAVDDVSLRIKSKTAVGLVGESGCGKTTLALAVTRLLPSNGRVLGGSIFFNGKDILSISEEEFRKEYRWKKISMVFQGAMNALNPVYRIGDQIAEAIIRHENVSKDEALERAKKLLSLVGIDPKRAKSYPHELSGGMKQRTMIAMALACNPEFLIADEPTTALDVIVQAQVLKLIKSLQQELGLTLMLITHDLSVVAEICDYAAVMYAGKLVESADIVTIYKNPLHPYTKGLVNAFPSIRGEKKQLVSIPGAPPNLLNPPSGCRFHPRCPYAMEICRREEPELVKVDGDHQVACHLVSR